MDIVVYFYKLEVSLLDILTKITDLMLVQGKSQTELTKYLGLQNSAFTKWKLGKNTSYKKYLPEIANFLDTSIDYLLGNTEYIDFKSLYAAMLLHSDNLAEQSKFRDEQLPELSKQVRTDPDVMKKVVSIISEAIQNRNIDLVDLSNTTGITLERIKRLCIDPDFYIAPIEAIVIDKVLGLKTIPILVNNDYKTQNLSPIPIETNENAIQILSRNGENKTIILSDKQLEKALKMIELLDLDNKNDL